MSPKHRIETKPAGVRVRVTFKGQVIADSRDAIRMDEGKYPPVYYLPRKDVRMERLERSEPSHALSLQGRRFVLLPQGWTGKRGLELRAAVRRGGVDSGIARLLSRPGFT